MGIPNINVDTESGRGRCVLPGRRVWCPTPLSGNTHAQAPALDSLVHVREYVSVIASHECMYGIIAHVYM